MLVNELLDKKVNYKIARADSEKFKTVATINGRKIEFTAEPEGDEYPDEWVATFSEVGQDSEGVTRNYGKTGKGGELEVFSMVKDSMHEFVSTFEPKAITFTASKEGNDNRANLYSRLLERFKIPGYTVKRRSIKHFDTSFDVFEITKNASK